MNSRRFELTSAHSDQRTSPCEADVLEQAGQLHVRVLVQVESASDGVDPPRDIVWPVQSVRRDASSVHLAAAL
jgi:hypothetical protein